jgi:hypothetical protein
MWGNPLPNPFVRPKPDLKGQSILMQRHPKLGELYKKAAESPWGAWAEWRDGQAAKQVTDSFGCKASKDLMCTVKRGSDNRIPKPRRHETKLTYEMGNS